MTEIVVARRRTGWDIALGVLLIIGGLVILGNVMIATLVSVLLIGWITFGAGLVALIAALFRIGKPGFWSTAVAGALLTVLGLVIVRHPTAAALTLTLLAGTIFLASGIAHIAAAFDYTEARWVMILSGVISTVFGLIILFDIVTATYTLLGVLLGIQVLIDGITILITGRLRVDVKSTAPVAGTAMPPPSVA